MLLLVASAELPAVGAGMVPRHLLFLHTLGNMSYVAHYTLGDSHPLGDSHSDSSETAFPCGLACISRMISGIELCSLDLLATCMSSLEQLIFKTFVYHLVGLCVCLNLYFPIHCLHLFGC